MANIRMSRINSEIQKAIAEIVMERMNNPEFEGLIISFIDVDTAADLSSAKVAVSVLADDDTKSAVVSTLNRSKSFIRKELMKEVRLRIMPDLHFYIDNSYEKGQHLMDLIDKVSGEGHDDQN